jgi:hypothetical protein
MGRRSMTNSISNCAAGSPLGVRVSVDSNLNEDLLLSTRTLSSLKGASALWRRIMTNSISNYAAGSPLGVRGERGFQLNEGLLLSSSHPVVPKGSQRAVEMYHDLFSPARTLPSLKGASAH